MNDRTTEAIDHIDHAALCGLIESGAAVKVEAVGSDEGWSVIVRARRRADRMLALQRPTGKRRVFGKFETLVRYLQKLGVTDIRVHIEEFVNEQRRDSASIRMKRIHQQAAHLALLQSGSGLPGVAGRSD